MTSMAERWLRSHHYTDVVNFQPPPLASPHISQTFSHREIALRAAAELDAEFALVLEREELKEGALIEPYCSTLFNMSVDVHGLSVESGATVLRGTAYYPHCVDHNNKVIQHLICQALATAWGLRPSGQLEIPSHLACTAGQTTPIPAH